MNGADVQSSLQRRYHALLAEAEPDAVSQIELCGDATRVAFIMVGLTPDNEASTTVQIQSGAQEGDVLSLARYELLRVLCDQLVVKADAQADMPKVMKRQSQIHDHALLMLQDAEAEIAHRGYGKSAVWMGRVQLDFLEPIQGYGYGNVLTPWYEEE